MLEVLFLIQMDYGLHWWDEVATAHTLFSRRVQSRRKTFWASSTTGVDDDGDIGA